MSTETPENTVSSASQFKQRREEKNKGELLTLTSGLVVKVRRPEVQKLIASGNIPANLVQVFLNMKGQKTENLKPEDLVKMMEFQRAIAEHALLEPTIKAEPNYDQNEISIDDLDSDDLDDVWAYVNGGLEGVKSFRDERNRVLPRPDSKEVSESSTK